MYYDNWDIDIYYSQKSYPVDDVKRYEWIEEGPVRATLLVEKGFSKSSIIQKITFMPIAAGLILIHMWTGVEYPFLQSGVSCRYKYVEATYDIQFGNIKRPTHKNTSWDMASLKYADISGQISLKGIWCEYIK